MKQYIITIAAASLLAGLAHILSPAGWTKYVKIITGLVILSVIASPLTSISNINLFSDFTAEESEIDENIQLDAVTRELTRRIEDDISERIKTEFSKEASAKVLIDVTENNEIAGVKNIKIRTDANPERVIERMCEVYGVDKDEVEINGL